MFTLRGLANLGCLAFLLLGIVTLLCVFRCCCLRRFRTLTVRVTMFRLVADTLSYIILQDLDHPLMTASTMAGPTRLALYVSPPPLDFHLNRLLIITSGSRTSGPPRSHRPGHSRLGNDKNLPPRWHRTSTNLL